MKLQKLRKIFIENEQFFGDDNFTAALSSLPELKEFRVKNVNFDESMTPNDFLKHFALSRSILSILGSKRGVNWNPSTVFPDFSVLSQSKSLQKFMWIGQTFASTTNTKNTLESVAALKNLKQRFVFCGNFGVEYPSPTSTLGLELQFEVFNQSEKVGAVMGACTNDTPSDKIDQQHACEWNRGDVSLQNLELVNFGNFGNCNTLCEYVGTDGTLPLEQRYCI